MLISYDTELIGKYQMGCPFSDNGRMFIEFPPADEFKKVYGFFCGKGSTVFRPMFRKTTKGTECVISRITHKDSTTAADVAADVYPVVVASKLGIPVGEKAKVMMVYEPSKHGEMTTADMPDITTYLCATPYDGSISFNIDEETLTAVYSELVSSTKDVVWFNVEDINIAVKKSFGECIKYPMGFTYTIEATEAGIKVLEVTNFYGGSVISTGEDGNIKTAGLGLWPWWCSNKKIRRQKIKEYLKNYSFSGEEVSSLLEEDDYSSVQAVINDRIKEVERQSIETLERMDEEKKKASKGYVPRKKSKKPAEAAAKTVGYDDDDAAQNFLAALQRKREGA